jgi:ATP-dependent Lon protease
MPRANQKNLQEVPDNVKSKLQFTFVESMDEVLQIALPGVNS